MPSLTEFVTSITTENGFVTGGTAVTPAQVTALLNLFTAIQAGIVPGSGGSVLNVLRGDVSWGPIAVPYFAMPPAPSALSSGTLTASSVVLTYTIDSFADGIVVFYRLTGSGPDNWTLYFAGAAGGTITVTGLLPNTQYDFALCAWNGAQNGPWKGVSATTSAGSIVGIKPWDMIYAAERPKSTRVDVGWIDQSPAIFPLPATLAPFLGWEAVAAADRPKTTQAPQGHIDYTLFAPPIPVPPGRGWETIAAERPKSTKVDPGWVDVPLFNPPIPPAPGRGWETVAAAEKPKSTKVDPGHVDYELWKVPQGPPGRGWEFVMGEKPKTTQAQPGHIDYPLFKPPIPPAPGRGWETIAAAEKPKSTQAPEGWVTPWTPPQLLVCGYYPTGETFSGSVIVDLIGQTGSAVYYTTDGSTPTTSSTLSSGAVSITTTTTLKTLCVLNGWINSPIGSQTYTSSGGSATITSHGTYNLDSYVPSGTWTVELQGWGAGGGGGTEATAGAGGGGGGAYATWTGSYTNGSGWSIVIGQGGASHSNGTDTTVNATTLVAKAGTGGANNGTTAGTGGAAASCTPSTGAFSGGSGGIGSGTKTASGGGSSAGTAANGNTGSTGGSPPGNGGAGGTAPTNGGAGGAGGGSTTATGTAGSGPGGGGGGGFNGTGNAGGAGADGQLIITWS